MLELPESQTLARQLKSETAGKTIEKVIARHTPHGFAFYNRDPEGYHSLLAGKTVTDVRSIGGQVEIEAEDACLLFNDGINVRLYQDGVKQPDKHQLLVELMGGSFFVCTVQMYGGMQVYTKGTYDNPYYMIAKEKPSPLGDDFNEDYFYKLLQETKPTISVKAFLATEQRIPGLGNGVLQDILFTARIHPKTKLQSLTDGQTAKLFSAVKGTLGEMTEQGGRDTEKDLYGKPGGYACLLSKNTLKAPCPVCGGVIARQAYLGGNIYFCQECQAEQ